MLSSNKIVVAILLFLPLLLTLTTIVPGLNDEIDTIKLRVLEQTVWPKPENVSNLVERVLNFSATLNSSCYWPDLSYNSGLPNSFDTEYHMWRVSNMLRAFTVNGSALKGNATILSQVHCALQVWFDHDWRNPNWWFNQIGIPLEAGMQLMMLGDHATPTEVANLKNITLRACWWIPNPFYVGANLLWMLQIQIYRCLGTRNTTGLQQAFSRMWQDVVMANSSNEGVQYDWAYHFHTRQLLSGSYGNVWLGNVLLFTNCSANTQYEPDEGISELVANYLANGDAWMIIDNEWDWHVYGRAVTDPGATFAHGLNTDWLRSLAGIVKSSDLKTRLNDFADRLDSKPEAPSLIGNRAFFASNYQVHRRTNWIATLKIQTGRMYPSECLLGQNLKHEHSGQGVLNIYRHGYNDYIGVFPVLDWQAINGITVEHDIPLVMCADAVYYYHNSRPNGGSVSDGQYGASMMDTLSHNLTAQRSWHFYDDAIIALATNLSVNVSATPWTTLASRLLPVGKVTVGFFNGTIVTLNDGNYTFPYAENKTTNVQWAHISEQNIGYLLQLQQFYESFGVEVGYKTGNYADIDPANITVTERVVTLYINHGLGPFLNRDYNYMILPNVSLESMPMLIKKYEEEEVFACILLNGSAPSHGTVWPSLKRATFVTWGNRSTTFLCKTRAYSLNMTIAYGGLYMFSETEQDFTITASNPMRTGGHLNVTVDREGYGQNCGLVSYNGTVGTNVMVYLPTENVYLGASMNTILLSYDGDLTRFSGASYTWGRESCDQYNESYAGVLPYQTTSNFLPDFPVKATFDNGTLIPFVSSYKLGPVGSADLNMMGYNYRLCFSNVTGKKAPFFKPTNYDPNNFILLQRYIDSLVESGKYPLGPPIGYLVSISPYHGYPLGDKYDVNRNGVSAFSSNAINLNQNYVNGTAEDRQRIAQIISDYILGMFWYILTSPLVPNNTRTSLENYGLCNDQWIENNHIPPQLYIREGLRLVNENMFTQNHIISGLCRNDTVAVGSWYFEVHIVTRTVNNSFVNNEGQLSETVPHINGSKSGRTFELPYSIMLPKLNEVTNLLVPVCHAATHVAYSATRVEPHFMLLGGAAAYAIINGEINVQAVDINYIQRMLSNDGVLLHYPKDHCDH